MTCQNRTFNYPSQEVMDMNYIKPLVTCTIQKLQKGIYHRHFRNSQSLCTYLWHMWCSFWALSAAGWLLPENIQNINMFKSYTYLIYKCNPTHMIQIWCIHQFTFQWFFFFIMVICMYVYMYVWHIYFWNCSIWHTSLCKIHSFKDSFFLQLLLSIMYGIGYCIRRKLDVLHVFANL